MPNADVEIGHRSVTVCHLANIAYQSGKTITWDAKRQDIANRGTINVHVSYAGGSDADDAD